MRIEGPQIFDIRSAFSAAITYDVPTLKLGGLSKVILHGWSVQSVIQARSAPPVDVSDANFFLFQQFQHCGNFDPI